MGRKVATGLLDGALLALMTAGAAPAEGCPKAVFTAVFRGEERHPALVTDRTSAVLPGASGETFRIVALDRLQNAARPAVVTCR